MAYNEYRSERIGSVLRKRGPAFDEQKMFGGMAFSGSPMKGFVCVEPEGIVLEADRDHWIGLALDYNPWTKFKKEERLIQAA